MDALVEGSVIREGSHIRVQAQLIRGALMSTSGRKPTIAKSETCLALESEFAQSIAEKSTLPLRDRIHATRLQGAPHFARSV